jgi:hypothetical protein
MGEEKGEAVSNRELVVLGIFIAYLLFILAVFNYINPLRIPANIKTLYLSANLFPLKMDAGAGPSQIEYYFYGTPLPNGTECIDKVAIYQYNYTNQTLYQTPSTIVTNPEGVYTIYFRSNFAYLNSSKTSTLINVPPGYTLLCPDVVNAVR